MLISSRKTTTVLAALVLGLGVMGAAAPSFADNNGSMASPAFPPDGVVSLGIGPSAPDRSYSAYYPSSPRHRAAAPVESNYGHYQTGPSN
jgi:hypothetical protein